MDDNLLQPFKSWVEINDGGAARKLVYLIIQSYSGPL